MQKAVTAVHKLPQVCILLFNHESGSLSMPLSLLIALCLSQDVHSQAASSHQGTRDSVTRTLTEAALLTEELLDLQEVGIYSDSAKRSCTHVSQTLMDADDQATIRSRKRIKFDDNRMLQDDPTECLVNLSESASMLEAALHPNLVQTFNKWSTKVQTVAPNLLLPDRTAFRQSDRELPLSGVAVVDDMLRFDGPKLLARTRTLKGSTTSRRNQLTNEDDVESTEVFDDTDFYQQLLRDVIKMRGAASGEPQWLEQQRKSKAARRKTVDTKASKGRKLRYETHEKLQHFMVPVVRGGWHEEQIDVLFSSLLGGVSV